MKMATILLTIVGTAILTALCMAWLSNVVARDAMQMADWLQEENQELKERLLADSAVNAGLRLDIETAREELALANGLIEAERVNTRDAAELSASTYSRLLNAARASADSATRTLIDSMNVAHQEQMTLLQDQLNREVQLSAQKDALILQMQQTIDRMLEEDALADEIRANDQRTIIELEESVKALSTKQFSLQVGSSLAILSLLGLLLFF